MVNLLINFRQSAVTRPLFSHRMFQAFVPYKRPYARQNFTTKSGGI
jgi:hypothetical protein